jgi:hypothetical protein
MNFFTGDEVHSLTVDTGDGDDYVDLSLINSTDFPNLRIPFGYTDVYLREGDDYLDGPSFDEYMYADGGDGERHHQDKW